MKLRATSVKAIHKYRLQIGFNDGTNGIYDVSSLAGTAVFNSWENEDTFFNVFINPENNAIAWNHEMEIDTLTAYLEIKGISFQQYAEQNRNPIYASS
jgi:hypothetical protein